MKEKKGKINFFYISMTLACLGISSAFVPVYSNSYLFVLAIFLIIPLLVHGCVSSKGILLKQDVILILFVISAVAPIIFKLIYYKALMLSGPIVIISCFLLLLVPLLYRDYSFSFFAYFLINAVGIILLSIGIFIYSNTTWGVVAIGGVNPQTIGSWAMIYVFGAMLSLDHYIHKFKYKFIPRILEMLVIGLMLYFAWITDAKFALVTVVAALIVRCLPILRFFDSKIFRLLAAFSPTFFLAVLVLQYKLSGKALLNGRERIWVDCLRDVIMSPIFGVGYNAIDANSFYSHNMIVDQLTLAGVPVTLLFQVCLSYVFIRKVPYFSLQSSSRVKYNAFVSFLLVLVASTVEGCFFGVGAGGLFLFSFAPLFIAVSDGPLES